MLEALKPSLEAQGQGKVYWHSVQHATDSLVAATCRIAFRYLSRQKDEARDLREKMV